MRGLNVSFEEHAYRHLHHCLDPRLFILMDFVNPDVVFTILSRRNLRHDCYYRRIVRGEEERRVRAIGQMLEFLFFGFNWLLLLSRFGMGKGQNIYVGVYQRSKI